MAFSRVYSVRMAIGHQAAGLDTVVYTCPVGHVAIVRDIDVVPDSGIASNVYVNINGVANMLSSPGGPAAVNVSWRGRQVMHAGDTLRLGTPVGGWQFLISGYELSL